jgi:hypothetical protein
MLFTSSSSGFLTPVYIPVKLGELDHPPTYQTGTVLLPKVELDPTCVPLCVDPAAECTH